MLISGVRESDWLYVYTYVSFCLLLILCPYGLLQGKTFQAQIKRLPESRNTSLGAAMQPGRQDGKVPRPGASSSSPLPEGSLGVCVPPVFPGSLWPVSQKGLEGRWPPAENVRFGVLITFCQIKKASSRAKFSLLHPQLIAFVGWDHLPHGSAVKKLPTMQETQAMWVWSLDWEDPLEEEVATHSSILASEIPWTEEP